MIHPRDSPETLNILNCCNMVVFTVGFEMEKIRKEVFGKENLKFGVWVSVSERRSRVNRALPFKALVCVTPRNTKGGSITVQLTSCLTGLESAV